MAREEEHKADCEQHIAATSLKQLVKRQGTLGRMPSQRQRTNGDIGTEPDENTTLISRALSSQSGAPYYKHEQPLVRWPALVIHTTWLVLLSNYVNVLLIFVPLGIISGALHWNPTTTFILNFLAIMPLASLLSFATEELAVPLGETLGGLMNATFGNAVELIVREHRSC